MVPGQGRARGVGGVKRSSSKRILTSEEKRDHASTEPGTWHVNPTLTRLPPQRQGGLVLDPIGPPNQAEEPRTMSEQGTLMPRHAENGVRPRTV